MTPEETTAALADLAETLRRDNPTLEFVSDDSAAWLRDRATGRDLAIYAATIDGHIMQPYQSGSTVVHRPIPEEN